VVSIVPPEPDSKTDIEPSLRGIGELMRASGNAFAPDVGAMIEWVGEEHQPPVTCGECRDRSRDESLPCLSLTHASTVAYRWLLDWIEELQ
jgi:hypothetical protein